MSHLTNPNRAHIRIVKNEDIQNNSIPSKSGTSNNSAQNKALLNPLVLQLTALADSLDAEIARILGE